MVTVRDTVTVAFVLEVARFGCCVECDRLAVISYLTECHTFLNSVDAMRTDEIRSPEIFLLFDTGFPGIDGCRISD